MWEESVPRREVSSSPSHRPRKDYILQKHAELSQEPKPGGISLQIRHNCRCPDVCNYEWKIFRPDSGTFSVAIITQCHEYLVLELLDDHGDLVRGKHLVQLCLVDDKAMQQYGPIKAADDINNILVPHQRCSWCMKNPEFYHGQCNNPDCIAKTPHLLLQYGGEEGVRVFVEVENGHLTLDRLNICNSFKSEKRKQLTPRIMRIMAAINYNGEIMTVTSAPFRVPTNRSKTQLDRNIKIKISKLTGIPPRRLRNKRVVHHMPSNPFKRRALEADYDKIPHAQEGLGSSVFNSQNFNRDGNELILPNGKVMGPYEHESFVLGNQRQQQLQLYLQKQAQGPPAQSFVTPRHVSRSNTFFTSPPQLPIEELRQYSSVPNLQSKNAYHNFIPKDPSSFNTLLQQLSSQNEEMMEKNRMMQPPPFDQFQKNTSFNSSQTRTQPPIFDQSQKNPSFNSNQTRRQAPFLDLTHPSLNSNQPRNGPFNANQAKFSFPSSFEFGPGAGQQRLREGSPTGFQTPFPQFQSQEYTKPILNGQHEQIIHLKDRHQDSSISLGRSWDVRPEFYSPVQVPPSSIYQAQNKSISNMKSQKEEDQQVLRDYLKKLRENLQGEQDDENSLENIVVSYSRLMPSEEGIGNELAQNRTLVEPIIQLLCSVMGSTEELDFGKVLESVLEDIKKQRI